MALRVAVVTAGHLSTCPRMVKAADALHGAGHEVHVVSARFLDWASDADRVMHRGRSWAWRVVDYSRPRAPIRAALTGARWRAARSIVGRTSAASAPWWAVTRAFSRIHPELVRAARATAADVYYGGTTGALAAVAEAATGAGRPFALDLEDLHTAESRAPDAHEQHRLAARIEEAVLGRAAFLTTSSDAIAAAYRERYGIEPVAIHNVFPLPGEPPPALDLDAGPLRLYWFSQTIGPGRGLEQLVDAMRGAAFDVVCRLRGRALQPYLDALVARALVEAPRLTLDVQPPVPADAILAEARHYHVGLALEAGDVENARLCVSNKLLTYPLAGLAVVATDLPGARVVARDFGDGIAWCAAGDAPGLAAALERWQANRCALAAARRASWSAARDRWHWEHAAERGRLLGLFAALDGAGSRAHPDHR